SVTIGGTVSPAGGNFEEPVTQATLKVVGAFHGLSRERSDARKYPAIHPLESWSKYGGLLDPAAVDYGRRFLERSAEVGQMMKVVGEEGTSLDDYVVYQKGEFLDAVYLQQNSFDPVDCAVSPERQRRSYRLVLEVLAATITAKDKEDARRWFYGLRQKFLDLNGAEWKGDRYVALEAEIGTLLDSRRNGADARGKQLVEALE
ncbi:MAG: V-type ATP synthase subunit A, partial [Spirochaetaceae bacterium]|nr:V-type ATP synthase subunit A [Spirochaetaceae bacterium]